MPGSTSQRFTSNWLLEKKRSSKFSVYSVIHVGLSTVWTRKAFLEMSSSCWHCFIFVACGFGHSFSQFMSARLKSPPSHK
ncbi:hypothetical protein DPMN_102925 [Dreissena polymorpha]|uniref:Uncharacterized protein n=1 Tax=Dreissena polymorpha TaxID=45954 RepID=A0A9D4JYM2_DREPO|nr:hypothetical protein DPMN_102837 [Dreissena polymorpha]KAH3829697.1 hypothetical protein DPMN_102925 [Dreissena polymorpha]